MQLRKLGIYYHLKMNCHDPYRLGNIRPKQLLLFSFNIQVIKHTISNHIDNKKRNLHGRVYPR